MEDDTTQQQVEQKAALGMQMSNGCGERSPEGSSLKSYKELERRLDDVSTGGEECQ